MERKEGNGLCSHKHKPFLCCIGVSCQNHKKTEPARNKDGRALFITSWTSTAPDSACLFLKARPSFAFTNSNHSGSHPVVFILKNLHHIFNLGSPHVASPLHLWLWVSPWAISIPFLTLSFPVLHLYCISDSGWHHGGILALCFKTINSCSLSRSLLSQLI